VSLKIGVASKKAQKGNNDGDKDDYNQWMGYPVVRLKAM
jgi:hypothetical protein